MSEVKIGIHDPYLDTMSGGEKYMLSIALSLTERHEVLVLWDPTQEADIKERAKERFGFDLESLSFKPTIFSSTIGFLERYTKSREYDGLIYLSDGSIPLVSCPLYIHFQSPMPWVNGKSLKNRFKLSKVRQAFCNSEFTKSWVDKTYGVNSKVIYPPVSIKGNYEKSKKEKIILNVGRFGINHAGSSFKKQDVLADVFMELCQQGLKDWKLVFVMAVKESEKKAVEAFKEKYKGAPIECVVNTDNTTLWKWYEKASVYWHAAGFGEDLANHPDRAEHFGISTVEAMGVGAVPVVFNAGGQKEIIHDKQNGRLWNSVEELQNITLELSNTREELEKLAEHGVQSARKFSYERFCQEMLELIT